jgi:hypothetical protein
MLEEIDNLAYSYMPTFNASSFIQIDLLTDIVWI